MFVYYFLSRIFPNPQTFFLGEPTIPGDQSPDDTSYDETKKWEPSKGEVEVQTRPAEP